MLLVEELEIPIASCRTSRSVLDSAVAVLDSLRAPRQGSREDEVGCQNPKGKDSLTGRSWDLCPGALALVCTRMPLYSPVLTAYEMGSAAAASTGRQCSDDRFRFRARALQLSDRGQVTHLSASVSLPVVP